MLFNLCLCSARVRQKTTVSACLRLTLLLHQGQRMWSSLPNMFSICRHCHTDGNDWEEHVQTEWVAAAPSTDKYSNTLCSSQILAKPQASYHPSGDAYT